ncbi:histidine kinase N-terminal 7TM domain-containing diguanylate cyclase [Rhodovulum adriaticum]|nr:diguanylate cyclase [Rhodovulum adriaticum]
MNLLILVAFTHWVSKQPDFVGKAQFRLTNIGLAWWLLTAGLELQSTTASCKTLFAMAAWPGIMLISVSWLAFISSFALRADQNHLRRDLVVIACFVLIGTVAAWTNPLHGLFYTDEVRLVETAGRLSAQFEHGPLFYLAVFMNYCAVLAAFLIVLLVMRRTSKVYRRYFAFFLLITVIPILANAAYTLFDFTVFGFDPTPFVFTFVLLGLGLLIFNKGFFDIVAVGREVLYYRMANPVFVVNRMGIITGLNTAAKGVVHAENKVGQHLSSIPAFQDFQGVFTMASIEAMPERLQIGEQFFDVDVFPIGLPVGDTDELIGATVLLTDVTDLYSRGRALASAVDVMNNTLNQNRRQLEEIQTLREEAERLADRDWLTGLLNRRRLDESFKQLAEERDDNKIVVLCVLDLDHFKSINDRFGHVVGDRVLKGFAQMMESILPEDAICFRVGGEEFVVLHRAATVAEVVQDLNRLREALDKDPLMRRTDVPPVTFSGGVASFPADGETLDALYAKADEHLYTAKEKGRNRIVQEG